MGEVYIAETQVHSQTRRHQLLLGGMRDLRLGRSRRTFFAEARRASVIKHPGIARARLDVHEDGRETSHGADARREHARLHREVGQRRPRRGPGALAPIFRPDSHRRSPQPTRKEIIHRDIKPTTRLPPTSTRAAIRRATDRQGARDSESPSHGPRRGRDQDPHRPAYRHADVHSPSSVRQPSRIDGRSGNYSLRLHHVRGGAGAPPSSTRASANLIIAPRLAAAPEPF